MNIKKINTLSLIAILFLMNISFVSAADNRQTRKLLKSLEKSIEMDQKSTDKLKKYIKKRLLSSINNSIFIQEVNKQNSKKISIAEIKEIDKQWMETEDELPIQKEKLSNVCADEIRKIIKLDRSIIEVFVMDNQGAVVGENNLTSDYWQGDEAKWKNAFNEGKGGVDISKIKYDKSAAMVLQQVSLPIIDTEGQVVGSITYGIAINKL